MSRENQFRAVTKKAVSDMTRKMAIDIVVALACCASPILTCEDCPLRNRECNFNEEDVVKAVKVLKGGAE